MTADEVVESALARLSGVADQQPSARAPYWRRVGNRQQQLFVLAARIDPEFYGVCAVGTLENGAVSIAAMEPPVRAAAAITRIEVEDPGTSELAAGAEIVPVPVLEQDEPHEHPRVLLRNRAIVGVGADLDGVVSIKVSYPYLPAAIRDGEAELELPEPFDELCVLDLAKWMLRRLPETEGIVALLNSIEAEEKELIGEFTGYVERFATSRQARFAG